MKKNSLFILAFSGLLASCATPGASSSSSATSSEQSQSSSQAPTSSATSASPASTDTAAPSSSGASTLPAIDYVVVFCETHWTNVWAWDEEGNFFDAWPGASLKDYDKDWKTYSFEGKTSFNIIFSEEGGKNQTRDLSIPSMGYWWYYQDQWYQENPIEEEDSSSSSEEISSGESTSEQSSTPTPGALDNRHRTWYQLLVYSFADGNNDGIGDFKGLVEHLDYLKNLGIGGIWLSPVHPSADYHGYDVKDYYSIDSKYEVGGYNFAKLISECHKRDIRVLMDMVLNHTSDQHPWTREHPDWYSGEHVFSGSMPDLNYDNQAVRTEIKKIGKYWLDKGADGFRCDGAAWIYGGGGGWNVESDKFAKTIDWWKEYASYLKTIKSDVYLVGECWTGLQYIEQFMSSGMSAFNFSARYWERDAMNNSNTAKWVEECVGHQTRARQNDPNAVEASFLSNHDTGRYTSNEFAGGDKNKLTFANALNAIAPGGSFVYYGDELGMSGSADGYTDQGYRTPMPFASGRTNGNSYMWRNAQTSTISGKSADEDAKSSSSMYSSLAKVINYKNSVPALYSASVSQISSGKNEIGVMKYEAGEEDYYLIANASGGQVTASLSGTYSDEFKFTVNGSISLNNDEVKLPGYSFVLVKAASLTVTGK